jgi:DNA mismatch endonuclease (patch repair protein)
MRSNKSNDTKPEVETRRLLHHQGLRFRKAYPIKLEKTRSKVDIAFPRWHLAVYIDGCFWHLCPEHGHIPNRNVVYWSSKLKRNAERDREIDELLSESGWEVMRFWSHVNPEQIAAEVANRVGELKRADGI